MSFKTIKELIVETKLDPIDTKALLCHLLKYSKASLIIHNDKVLTNLELEQFHNLVLKRRSGCPIAYIVGVKEFYSREFIVNEATLIPRPETELLVDEVLKLAKPGSRILDLGTGSGSIAVTLKLELPSLEIVAVDRYQNTLDVAQENAKMLGAEIQLIQSDWLEGVSGAFDIIVSNPPYIDKNDAHLADLQHEPLHALTDFNDGLDCYRIITKTARKHLSLGGILIFEHGYLQKKEINKILHEEKYTKITTVQDYASLDRITYGRAN